MAKLCPITNKKVIYLTCLECEEKLCEQETPTERPTKIIPPMPNEHVEKRNNTTDSKNKLI